MASKEIGKAFVTIGAKGFEKLKTTFGKVKVDVDAIKKKFTELKDGLGTLANKAAVGFATLSAAVTTFVAAASPEDFDDFKGVLAEIGVQIGRVLVPILREFTKWLEGLRDYLRGLSSEQREQITGWVKWALVVAAATVAVAKLGQALLFLATSNPVGALITALGIVVGLLIKAKMEADAFDAKLKRLREGKIQSGDVKDKELQRIMQENQTGEIGKEETASQLAAAKADQEKKLAALKQEQANQGMGSEGVKNFAERKNSLEERLAQIEGLQHQLKTKGELGTDDADKQPEIRMKSQSAQLGSIMDAWRKVQTAQQGDSPEARRWAEQMKILEEGNKQRERGNEILEQVANNQGAKA